MSSESYDFSFNSRALSPTRQAPRLPRYANIPNLIHNRSLGIDRTLGATDKIVSSLYNSFDTVKDDKYIRYDEYWGGIFNLEFNLDGRLLVAACEGKQVLLYDASTQKNIKTIDNAHLNCVNCIKFLDDVRFATGSDDALVKLWDIRNLKSCMKTLHGHSNWVKNIEWSPQENVMVTSAFDGTVYAWDLNQQTENNWLFQKVLQMSGLMRMKLTPDGSKMIVSTTTGFMIIIHNLNLMSLITDLQSFRPNLYRLMQTSDQSFPAATTYNYLFDPSRKRNRIEFIDDFPNDAELISSLQIHPHGWSAVSRNFNSEKNEEWTAVHDIQERDEKDYDEASVYIEDSDSDGNDNNSDIEQLANQRPTDLWLGYAPFDYYNNVSNVNLQARQEMGIINSGLINSNETYNAYFQQHPNERNKIVKSLLRMTHYIEENNSGKGFIKGLSFSSDGRIICSPYERGVRLLAFSNTCQELSDCVPDVPQKLNIIVEMNDYHRDIVVSCRFSPNHYQLVTGCLGSQIKWYQPVL